MLICKGLHLKGLPLWRGFYCICSSVSRVLKGIRGWIAGPGPLCFPSWKKNLARNRSRKPSIVPPPSTTTIAVAPAEASPGKRPWLGDAGESCDSATWSPRKSTRTNTLTSTLHRDHNHRETHGGGEHRHRETRHRSRDPDREQDHSATGSGAATNQGSLLWQGWGRASRRRTQAVDWNRDVYIRQWLFCPFVLFFFFKSCIPTTSPNPSWGKGGSTLQSYVVCLVLCTAVAWIATAWNRVLIHFFFLL